MPINEQQRIERRQSIGSSDIPAILGVDPFRNIADVYWSKVQELDVPGNDAMDAGTRFEPIVVDWLQERVGPISRNVQRWHHKWPDVPIRCNCDGIVTATGDPAEAKTSGLLGPLHERWGDEMTADVPDRVLVQCHALLACTERELCEVAAFLGGRGFARFQVIRNEKLAEIIERETVRFWVENVQAHQRPDNVRPSIETLKAIRREPKSQVSIPALLIESWEQAKAVAKTANDEAEVAKTELIAALGDAEAGVTEDGRMVTYLKQTRKGYEVKATTFPVLKLAKGTRNATSETD